MTKKTMVITVFSFKGGTGRSTASANVASLLDKRGKKVGCIDFDIESAGLHYIFDVEDKILSQYGKVQDYLIKNEPSKEFDALNLVIEIPRRNNVFLIASDVNPRKNQEIKMNPSYFGKVASLIKQFSEKNDLDILFLDSRSGISEMALPSLAYLDVLFIFFKPTRQHKSGTRVLTKWIYGWFSNLKRGGRTFRIYLIPTHIKKNDQEQVKLLEFFMKQIQDDIGTTDKIQYFYENQDKKEGILSIPDVDDLRKDEQIMEDDTYVWMADRISELLSEFQK